VAEAAAYKPRWTPDGRAVGFNGALDATRTCICVIDDDGTDGRVLLASTDLAIDWFDWAVPAPPPPDAAGRIGSRPRASQVLMTQSAAGRPAQLVAASADLMHRRVLDVPGGLRPEHARWTADHRTVVFSARTRIPRTARQPHPAAPRGQRRREHLTLDDLDPLARARRDPQTAEPGLAEHQVFLRDAEGRVRPLTDPWTEDWRDGLRPGDRRANTRPAITPDGRHVLVVNTSTLSGESFLLRIDVRTGDVVNLTNGTAGVVPTDDTDPAVSPDGTRIAFSWTRGTTRGIHVMDTADGRTVRTIVDDRLDSGTDPAWTPDGRALVYTRSRPGTGRRGDTYALVRVDVATGERRELTPPSATALWGPVVAPEGDLVLYAGTGPRSVDLFAVPAVPGGGTRPRPAQPDPHADETSVDWR
jgi:hypothetical protein